MKCNAFIVLLLIAHTFCYAQKDYRIFDWKTEYTLNTYLIQQMHEQYDTRRYRFENALASPKTITAYAKDVRAKFRRLIGDLPEKSPLNATITPSRPFANYHLENIVYESFPNHHVTANLYIPAGTGSSRAEPRRPAVIFFCGHEDAGKATESYQETALLLVDHGFVVMVIDPVSQSERHQLTGPSGKPLTRGGTTEHTLINASSNLVGTSAAAYELWDNVRGLDYLVTRKEVDTSKIACAGNSGGAIQAIYFAAFDERIKAIAACSYLASRERTFELSGTADGCAQIPGEGKELLEMSDYLVAAAPRPLLVLAGRYDFIDYNSVLASVADLRKVYNVLGQPQNLTPVTFSDGHGISKYKRERLAKWLRHLFYGDPPFQQIKEPLQVATLQSNDLFATHEGQVNAAFNNEVTVFERNRALADTLEAKRKLFMQQDVKAIAQNISEIISAPVGEINIRMDHSVGFNSENIYGKVEKNGISFLKAAVEGIGDPPMPVLTVKPENRSPEKIVIWFHSGGKHIIADSASLIRTYLQQNAIVLICDLRGMGEMQDAPAMNDPKYYNKEYRTAMLALHSGSSLVAQRTKDVRNVLLSIIKTPSLSQLPFEIHATGPAGISVLHALIGNTRLLSSVKLYDCINSFKDILDDPIKKDWYSYVIPNVLKYYDIPDLVNLIGKEKIQFINLQK